MENRVEDLQATMKVNAGDSPSPEKKIVRRRFVQSTLFPQKSPNKKDGDCGGVDAAENGSCHDEEECCGSQGRKKRKNTPGRKPASQPRRAKKIAQNGNVAFQGAIDERDSPGPASPQTQKEKRRASTRVQRTNGKKEGCMGRLPAQTTLSDHISQPVPDLWLEAKKTAEEDSRRFAGKQLHPFFSSWKTGRKTQEPANADTGKNLDRKGGKKVKCGPIHVCQNVKDDITSIDWSRWAFRDEICSGPSCHEHNTSSSFQSSVGILQLDDILDITKPPEEPYLDYEPISQAANRVVAVSSAFMQNVVEPCQLSEDIVREHNGAEFKYRSENSSCLRSDLERANSALQEGLPYYFSRIDQPQTLWIHKYRPENAIEVCGNAESVKFINDWLHLWHERDLWNRKELFKSEKCSQPEDSSSYDVDSDAESIDEEAGLKNVLLVVGPVGSGKSAAIYACAKEQGFEVIEVNSSDWRSGALVKQKFGEAVGLHWLKGISENPKGLQSMLKGKSSLPTPTNGATADEFKDDVNKPIPIPDDETANGEVLMCQRSVCSETTNIRDSGEIKTLILFEDVNATLCEDRGLIASIQQLAQTAKRPMILTSNSWYPLLPDSMSREEVYFRMPSQKELLHHVCMVCNAEKSSFDSHMIEKYIQYCQGDIRKTMMHLQFWCHGQECKSDCKTHKIYSPLMFDLEAGHQILPKIIPWGFPSELSEHVEMEVAKSSHRMEESSGLFEMRGKVENAFTLHERDADEGEMTSIEAKKQAILSRNFAIDDNDLIAPVVNPSEVSNSSGSPIAFSRRSTGKKLGLVLFDSEDEISNYESPRKSENLCRDSDNNLTVSATEPESQTDWPTVDMNLLTGQLVHSGGSKLAEAWHQCSLTANVNNEPCHSGDISCVPESTFVPETEVDDGMEISARADQTEVLSPVIFEKMGQPILKQDGLSETKEFACDIIVNLVDDEMGDSQNECGNVKNLTKGYQLLDECSRMHFHRGSRHLKKCSSHVTTNAVQEVWKSLRCADLRQQITNEDKNASQAMRLVSKACSLIAEADLLLRDCKILTTESVIPDRDLIDKSFICGAHDERLHMTSATAEHGYCVFAKDAAALGSKIGLDSRVDIVQEMLASTSNSMALGKLLRRHDRRTSQTSFTAGRSDLGLAITGTCFERDWDANLHNIVQSVIPPKFYLAMRGSTMNEYLSTLSHISKSEAHRSSETPDNTKRRRKRVPRNYLSSGSLSLSPEDISILTGYNFCGKFPSNQQR